MWDIRLEVSFQHPMVPYDVLVDPQSIPTHPMLTDETESDEDVSDVIEDDEDFDTFNEIETLASGKVSYVAWRKICRIL